MRLGSSRDSPYDNDARPSPTDTVREYDLLFAIRDTTNGEAVVLSGRYADMAEASRALVRTVVENEGDEDWAWVTDARGLPVRWIGDDVESDSYDIVEI